MKNYVLLHKNAQPFLIFCYVNCSNSDDANNRFGPQIFSLSALRFNGEGFMIYAWWVAKSFENADVKRNLKTLIVKTSSTFNVHLPTEINFMIIYSSSRNPFWDIMREVPSRHSASYFDSSQRVESQDLCTKNL